LTLCDGTCSGTSGANVIDAFAFSEGDPAPALPSPAVFSPSGMTGITDQNTNSYYRGAYGGVHPTFLQSDWNVAASSR
jgi:hypothetical protein